MKHTKGPWTVKNMEIFDKKGEGICVPYSINDNDEANARLIAAAPTMFEVIKYLSTERNPNIYTAMDMAMKVYDPLAKAIEGEGEGE